MGKKTNRYSLIMEKIFFKHHKTNLREVSFRRSDIEAAAKEMGIKLPKNLGDVIYSFRYRAELPARIKDKAPRGYEWIIRSSGRSLYKFVAVKLSTITPSKMLAETKILDATPGIIERYTLNDEQALLAKLRYNRLIDIFAGITCYSLQSHLRTTVSTMGQIETDEIYIGIDKKGSHYVLPVQVKGPLDRIGIVQIEQDVAVSAQKFPELICRPIAAQVIEKNLIALFELDPSEDEIKIVSEKHYRLVGPDELSSEELNKYKVRRA